jgi:hypothetical protein
VAGVAWGVGYLGLCYLFTPLAGAGLAAVVLLLGAGPLAGAAAGWLSGAGAARSSRHGLAAGVPVGLAFAALFWYSMTTPFGAGGAFYAAKYTLATSAADFPIIARRTTLVVVTLTVGGAVGLAGLATYAGRVAEHREEVRFIEP